MDERCKVCGGELTDAKVCTDCGARHAYRLDQLVVLAEGEDAYEVEEADEVWLHGTVDFSDFSKH